MVVRPDSDVERALKAFGDLSLKYRSFGAIPLRLGGTSIIGQSGVPSLDGIAFDTMGTDQPSSAADTFPLLGSALSEARDVPVSSRHRPAATGYGSGYPAVVTWQAPPPASLTEHALGRAAAEQAAYDPPPAAYVPAQTYMPPVNYDPAPAPAPTTVYVPTTTYAYVPPPVAPISVVPAAWPEEPEVSALATSAPDSAPAPVVERPVYASAPPARSQPDAPLDVLPTIFSHMRAAPPEPEPEVVIARPLPEPVGLAPAFEPLPDAGTGLGEPLAPYAEIIQPPVPHIHVQVPGELDPMAMAVPVEAAPPVVAPVVVTAARAGLARRGPPAQKQPLAGLFRSLAHPEQPAAETVAAEPLAP